MKKQPTSLSWYVGRFNTPRGVVYRYLRVRVIGTLERLFNGLNKTVIEQYASGNRWKKVKPSDFEEVGGPFGCRRRAAHCLRKLAGGDQRLARQ
ncbi:hypothetical protein ABIB06_006569 [Bradyrhizobium sp. LB8.2]|uniref:hypothetical protein n=1 Tax=unclassified Bradyrhizobium TaxID=2631580 RepID=UPI0033941BF2